MKNIQVRSYAKINILLNINGKLENNYHDLDMIMVPLELHDSILITEIPGAIDNFVTMDDLSDFAPEFNTVAFALNTLHQKYNFNQKFKIFVHKNIPSKAGLGGGSSNAAFTMKAINQFLNLGATNNEIIDMCKTLGADVSFFVDCKPSRCRGIGDKITPITIKNDYYVLLVKPNQGCSTKAVYAKSDEMTLKSYDIDKTIKALETGDDELLASSLGNALEEPAISIVPEIQDIKDSMKNLGLKIVLMSGSGSTVFALSTNKKELKKAAKFFEDKYFTEITKVKKD